MNTLSFMAGSGAIAVMVLLITFLMKDWFLEHFIKKIERLSDKDDIRNINERLNQVEARFVHETQSINNQLAVSSNLDCRSIGEEKNSIVEFNKNYFAWFELYSTMFTTGALVNNSDIEEYIKKVESLNLQVVYSIVNIEFFVKDDKLTSIINELKQDTYDTFKNINQELVKYFKSSNIELDLINTFHDKSESESTIVELFEIRTLKYKDFSNKAIFLKKEIIVKQKEVLDYCKSYISSLSNQ